MTLNLLYYITDNKVNVTIKIQYMVPEDMSKLFKLIQ